MNNLLTRAVTFQPSTFDAEKRTVQVVFSTGCDVMRSDFEGPYVERLSMDRAAVDLSQLIDGPLLDNHDRTGSIRGVLGKIETASVDGERGTATVRFSDRHQDVFRDVQAGIIRNVSAGYTVQKWETSRRADGARVKTAVKWKPLEISFTAIPADIGATTRGEFMNEQLQQQIRDMAAVLELPTTFADGQIQRNATIEDARAAAIAELRRQAPVIDNRQPPATISRDAGDGLVTRMADGLRARMNRAHQATEGREFATYRMSDIARRCLELRGLSTLGGAPELIQRALHTTSDFAAVLQESYNKELLSLRVSNSPIAQVFKRATVSDFRNRHILEVSDGPALEKVNEKGEVRFGSISDKELASYKIASYAKGFGITFQALVNDDLAAISDITAKASRGARTWFAGFLVDTIIANPNLADNIAVFHASHGNLASSGNPPSENTIAEGKLAMRLQKDLSGNPIDAAPKFIVAPASMELQIDRLMASLFPQQPADAVVSLRNLTPVIDPRFDAKGQENAFYLFAEPSIAPVFEYAELESMEGPQVETRQGFETLGIDVRVVWHAGAGAIDSRGAWKNPGA